jgi:RmuC family
MSPHSEPSTLEVLAGLVQRVEAAEAASKAVEMRIRSSAKDICEKYVHPPHSTDFAVLFLPTEGLFAEIKTAGVGGRSSTGLPHRSHWPYDSNGAAK